MARATHHAGRNSRGLVRRFEGKVELGEPEVIGFVEESNLPAPKTGDADGAMTENDGRNWPSHQPWRADLRIRRLRS